MLSSKYLVARSIQMTLEADKDFAILIPAYNEEKTILNVLTPLLELSPHIIVVADGCTDNTISTINHLPITILQNETNEGKGACLQKGFASLQGRLLSGVITLDADGQHHPQDIIQVINGIKFHPNSIIIGARQGKKLNCPKPRYYANKLADFFISLLLRRRIVDSQSGFRFYPQSFIEKNLQSSYKRFGYETLLLFLAPKNKVDITNVEIHAFYPENSRKSYYRPIVDSVTIILIMLHYLVEVFLDWTRKRIPGLKK